MTLRIDEWFAPMSFGDFRREALGCRPTLALEPRAELAASVMEALGVRSPEDMFALQAPTFYAWFHKLNGQHSTAQVSSSAARQLYASGMTIYVQDIPDFAPLQKAIACELGAPGTSVKCTPFANNANASTRAHFDSVDLIAFQLTGRKVWQIAPNTFASTPVRTWATLDLVPTELRIYAHDVPPRSLPEGGTELELLPGSALHLPRGYWHETVSDCDSLSLHVQIVPTTYADAFLCALRNELYRDERWRASTYEWSQTEFAEKARLKAQDMLQRFRAAAQRLDVAELLPSTPADEIPPGPYVRSGQSSFGIESRDSTKRTASVSVIRHEVGGTTRPRIEMSDDFAAASSWIAHQETGMAIQRASIREKFSTLSPSNIDKLLETLVRVGLLRRMNGKVRGDA